MDDIIAQMSQDKDIKRAITRSNLYKFWKNVAGEKFAQNSRPFSMLKGNIMVIACKTPIVAQELMLRKTQLITKLQPYLKSLKMNIKDLKFDYKKWTDEN